MVHGMSILLECLAVVVPRRVLDVSYPGGADALIERAWSAEHPARSALYDESLVVLSFWNPEDARAELDHLMSHDMVYVDNDECVEICVCDQELGPVMPCSWLAWERSDVGYTHVWLADMDEGPDLIVWDGWDPSDSRDLTRTDLREDPARMMRLSRDANGVETWLDLETGQLSGGLSSEEESAAIDLLRSLRATQ